MACQELCWLLLELENGIFRAWWMEPLVASLSFAAAIHFYWYYERQQGLSRCHPNNFWEEMNVFGRKKSGGESGDLTNSLLAYWIGIIILRLFVVVVVQVVPVQHHRPDGIPENFKDVISVLGEVISGIMAYDAIFFVLHWLMHKVPCLQYFHRKHHHHSPTVEARDVLRHSIIDGTLQVLCNILAQQHNLVGGGVPKSRLARLIHNVLVTWMLTESHTSSPEPQIFRRWFVGVRHHRYHHHHHHHHHPHHDEDPLVLGTKKYRRRGESYQQFFGYLDRVLCEAHRRHERPPPPPQRIMTRRTS